MLPRLPPDVRPPRARLVGAGLAVALLAITSATAFASSAPGLGTASAYAILAGTPSISNTDATTVSGSMGISPAAAVDGFPPGVQSNGTTEAATAAAGTAKNDLTTAYNAAAASACNFDKTGQNLGGMTLTPGTYCQSTAPTLTGTLTLSGDGVFIFKAGSTMVTAPGAQVVLTNGAQACNVFWQVSSSATLDTTTTFVGTILALTDITINNGVNLAGRALARNGQVTLINDHITVPTSCNAAVVPGPTTTVTVPAPTASPGPRMPPAGGEVGASAEPPWMQVAIAILLGAGAIFVVRRQLSRRRP